MELAEALLAEIARELQIGEGITRRPASTYRLQLHGGFGFRDAARIVPYLDALGITDLYLSPVLAAAPGSTHGYDVVDHGRLNPELGGEEGFNALAEACARRRMGILLDFVPNHMAIGRHNRWWLDVLENGPSSVWAPTFDVDWTPLKTELDHKVLLPVLGDQYGRVLESGQLVLAREGGALVIRYFDDVFPVAPRSVPLVLRHDLDTLCAAMGPSDAHYQELESICVSLEKLAPRSETSTGAVADRAREKEVAKRRLAALCEASPRVREFLDGNVQMFNGRVGDPRSFGLLDRLLDAQAYRLAFWRVAGEEINYRRFFDVNGLAAIRMEDPRVFAEAHRLVLALLREGRATGLRIDHPDGLYAPAAYFRRVQAAHLLERARLAAARLGRTLDAATEPVLLDRIFEALARGSLPARPLYVVVEKIILPPERLPEGWDVDGTTGYEFLALVNGLFVDPGAERTFDAIWARVCGGVREDFREVVAEKKRIVMSSSMASEVNMLAHRLNRISEMNRRTRDFTLNELTRALVEFVALFPVYRTYVSRRGEVDERDRSLVEQTIARARRRSPVLDPSIYDFLRDVLLQRHPDGLTDDEKAKWLELTLRLQQVTGPVTAKAVEDTAFYTYARLVSLNEVGGDPRRFGAAPAEVHTMLAERRDRFPASLSATSTHDTKRSEDVRVRIDALSELPGEWRSAVVRWARMNGPRRGTEEGRPAPDRRDELFLYQTLVGAFPDEPLAPGHAHDEFVERIQGYMQKALREAKVHTSWTNPNEEYEASVRRFVATILSDPKFVADLAALASRTARAGRISSLSQVALKCAAPGVPDVYQGCELWDMSLVDPDNRRAVDFELRARSLEGIDAELARGPAAAAALARALSSPEGLVTGRAKLLLLRVALHLRREHPDLFRASDYQPLEAEGPLSRHLFAFSRAVPGRALVCAVPRLVLAPIEAGGGRIRWEGALQLPRALPRRWRDAVTGAEREGPALPLAELFSDFPVALLVSEDAR